MTQRGFGVESRGRKRKREAESEERLEKMARLYIEEAMTEARVRKCPRCKKPIVRSSGCPRITCLCGQGFCYDCGRPTIKCARIRCWLLRHRRGVRLAAARARDQLLFKYPRLKFTQCQRLLDEESDEEW